MKMKKIDQNGFSAVEGLIIVVAIAILAFVGWRVFAGKKTDTTSTSNQKANVSQEVKSDSPDHLIWQQTENGWQATEKAPACPSQPMFKMPADIKKVTSLLYPGQTRGGNYKPHGGFRFDKISDNTVKVTAPMDGYIVKGSRYFAEGTSEVQYTFDVMNNCGVMYRVGHLRELPANLQKLVDAMPQPSASSMLQRVEPAVYIKQGDVMATKVGITQDKNTFFDWGVYDYRQTNEASKSTAYKSSHPQGELAWHAVCWFQGWLPAADQAKLRALPAGDPGSGKTSDYCN